ncbi:MAG: folylpolyglutamate synthase/dihydrofolate synthase family protein [Prevotellaceae bacterium]|nr:folylpolyglutamate synthase/dihydrofolate synthase family protein [Prevotellaceae bacterium]
MTYDEAIDYLFTSAPLFQNVGAGAYKEGLSNTHLLDAHFHHPHRQFRSIHIAGTNGKGSCSHTIAAALQCAGYKVGLYTSPHLIDFRERIRINGATISEDYVIRFVEDIRTTYGKEIKEGRLGFSFFELATAMAFRYFADEDIDIAVVEVGLGGRLDCTNIISPILSVITNISLDHTQFLGNTLAEIAAEKAGIIKTGIPVVIGEALPETKPVFLNKANEVGAPIIFAEEQQIPFTIKEAELKGYCQEKNQQTILTALNILAPSCGIKDDSIRDAFAHVCELTGLMGRWQKMQEHPLVVCDTGHNIGGWKYLVRQIADTPCRHLHLILGFVNDKDITGILRLIRDNLKGKDVTFYFTQASVSRAMPADKLSSLASTLSIEGSHYSSVAEAYATALGNATADDFIYVGGSSFIVADFLKASIQ